MRIMRMVLAAIALIAVAAAAVVVIMMPVAAPPDARAAQSSTTLEFSNATSGQVTAYLKYASAAMGISKVKLVDTHTMRPVPVTVIDSATNLGRFMLEGKQTVSWDAFTTVQPVVPVVGGKVSFGAEPDNNCPVPGGPCGVTQGEFTINQPFEVVDISSVGGINAIINMDLTNPGAYPWAKNPYGPQTAQNSEDVSGDKKAWGVFPYRCTNCSDLGPHPPTCANPLGPANESYCKTTTASPYGGTVPDPVCQVGRVNGAAGTGGTVKFTFMATARPTPPPRR